MRVFSIKQLRNYTNDIIKCTESGEDIVIAAHGKPKALLVPITEIDLLIRPEKLRDARKKAKSIQRTYKRKSRSLLVKD